MDLSNSLVAGMVLVLESSIIGGGRDKKIPGRIFNPDFPLNLYCLLIALATNERNLIIRA